MTMNANRIDRIRSRNQYASRKNGVAGCLAFPSVARLGSGWLLSLHWLLNRLLKNPFSHFRATSASRAQALEPKVPG